MLNIFNFFLLFLMLMLLTYLFAFKFIKTEVILNTTESAIFQPTFLNTVGGWYLMNEY